MPIFLPINLYKSRKQLADFLSLLKSSAYLILSKKEVVIN